MIYCPPDDPKTRIYCTQCGLQLSAVRIASRSSICDQCLQDNAEQSQAELDRDRDMLDRYEEAW